MENGNRSPLLLEKSCALSTPTEGKSGYASLMSQAGRLLLSTTQPMGGRNQIFDFGPGLFAASSGISCSRCPGFLQTVNPSHLRTKSQHGHSRPASISQSADCSCPQCCNSGAIARSASCSLQSTCIGNSRRSVYDKLGGSGRTPSYPEMFPATCLRFVSFGRRRLLRPCPVRRRS